MSKEMTTIVLGVVVFVSPFLGIPSDWRAVLLVLAGLALTIVGFLLRGESLARTPRSGESNPFADAKPHPHEHHEGITSFN